MWFNFKALISFVSLDDETGSTEKWLASQGQQEDTYFLSVPPSLLSTPVNKTTWSNSTPLGLKEWNCLGHCLENEGDRGNRCNNIHEKISQFWLAESSTINPKQCKNLNFFECRKTKYYHRKLNKNDWQLTKQAFWLVNDQRNSLMTNQIFSFQIKRTPWMAPLMPQFFPDGVICVCFFCL